MINFTRAFDSAWERMLVILFRPFDLGKWFTIGFSAFLAGLLGGGNGINGSYNNNTNFGNLNSGTQTPNFSFQLNQVHSDFSHAFAGLQLGIIIAVIVIIFIVVLALVALMYWLGARGQFLFLDNIVRNRGAIAWPWSHYARQANGLFGIYLLLLFFSMLLLVPFLGIAFLMGLPLYRQHRWPEGMEIGGFILLGLIYLAVAIVLSFIIFIFKEFGVPLMFRHGFGARQSFMESLKLIQNHLASVFVFVLLRLVLFIAVAVLSLITCCMTCCLAALPYLGTVILLPALIYVRCFSLDCLAQFGPEYDVWTVDVPPAAPGLSPPPPLG